MKNWEYLEKDIANLFHGKRQPGSGCSPLTYKKGDVKSDKYLIECKFTEKDYYTLHVDTWEKIVGEAVSANRIPLFCCRGKEGTFLVGSTLDVDLEEDVPMYLRAVKSKKITNPMQFVLKSSHGISFPVVCKKIEI